MRNEVRFFVIWGGTWMRAAGEQPPLESGDGPVTLSWYPGRISTSVSEALLPDQSSHRLEPQPSDEDPVGRSMPLREIITRRGVFPIPSRSMLDFAWCATWLVVRSINQYQNLIRSVIKRTKIRNWKWPKEVQTILIQRTNRIQTMSIHLNLSSILRRVEEDSNKNKWGQS